MEKEGGGEEGKEGARGGRGGGRRGVGTLPPSRPPNTAPSPLLHVTVLSRPPATRCRSPRTQSTSPANTQVAHLGPEDRVADSPLSPNLAGEAASHLPPPPSGLRQLFHLCSTSSTVVAVDGSSARHFRPIPLGIVAGSSRSCHPGRQDPSTVAAVVAAIRPARIRTAAPSPKLRRRSCAPSQSSSAPQTCSSRCPLRPLPPAPLGSRTRYAGLAKCAAAPSGPVRRAASAVGIERRRVATLLVRFCCAPSE